MVYVASMAGAEIAKPPRREGRSAGIGARVLQARAGVNTTDEGDGRGWERGFPAPRPLLLSSGSPVAIRCLILVVTEMRSRAWAIGTLP